MLLLTRSEFENAASVLGIKPATLRQWRHRRAIPADAKLRLVYFFGQPFQLVESLEPQTFTKPASGTCLADLAGRYITHGPRTACQSPGNALIVISRPPGTFRPRIPN